MARLLLLIFCLSTHSSFSQLPDSIVLRYDKGHYSFGSSGQYSISEIVILVKMVDTSFYLESHFQLKKSFDSASNKITVDSIPIRVKKEAILDILISELLAELNTSKKNFNEAFVRPFLKSPSKTEVLNVAKKHDLDWMWKDADRQERKSVLYELKSFQFLDPFLVHKMPNTENDLVVIDVWNSFSLTAFHGNNVTEYRGQFFDLLGQPVKRFDNREYSKSNNIINLEINNAIKRLLPKNSLLRQAIDLNVLKEEYIKWYFENVM